MSVTETPFVWRKEMYPTKKLDRQSVRQPLLALLMVLMISFVMPGSVLAEKARSYDTEKLLYNLNSGTVSNNTSSRLVSLREEIRIDDASWLRLEFDGVWLNDGDLLVITALEGNQKQVIKNTDPQYGGRIISIIFDGGKLDLELHLAPGSEGARFNLETVLVARWVGGAKSQCGPTDDRIPFGDACCVRVVDANGGWGSGFMISDNLMLTAHHVMTFGPWSIQANVDSSDSVTGALENPEAADQFTVANLDYSETSGVTALGNDWAVVYVPNNATRAPGSGCSPAFNCTHQNTDSGVVLTIQGFGVDMAPDPTQNGVLQRATGPSIAGGENVSHFKYRVDTEEGGSGCRVANVDGRIVGIHTNGGCTAEGGSNSGTLISNPGLRGAIEALGGAIPCKEQVPSLTVWGMIALLALLILTSVFAIYRRRRVLRE